MKNLTRITFDPNVMGGVSLAFAVYVSPLELLSG
jgi:hypothetical protein